MSFSERLKSVFSSSKEQKPKKGRWAFDDSKIGKK